MSRLAEAGASARTDTLELQRRVLETISQLSREDWSALPPAQVFHKLLAALVAVTASDGGFIGDVFVDVRGQRNLKTRAVADAPEGNEWRDWYERNATVGLGASDLGPLVSEVLRTGQGLITNSPPEVDDATHTRPKPSNSKNLLVVPLNTGDASIGIAGLSTRTSAYSEQLLTILEPLLGTIAQLLVSDRERTRRIELEQAVRAGDERWNSALASSGVGIFDWDLVADCLYLSPEWKNMLGYGDDELKSSFNTWRELIHPLDLETTTRALEAHFAGSAPAFECECRLRHRNGSWRWARARGRVVAWAPAGGPARFVGTQTDVTAAHAAEEALVAAKVAALTAARQRSEFLAIVSHELRTPLNAVNGMATLLGDTPLDGAQRDYVNTLKVSSDALLTTLNDVLTLSVLDSSQAKLEKRAYDPRAIATEVLYNMRARAVEKGLALRYSGPSEPVWLLGDPRAVRQLLSHLIGNAIKFTETGYVNVVASMDSGRVCFRIEDTGIGIQEEYLDRVFEPFAQLHPSFTRGGGDSGLGLAICKRLVDLMAGQIRLETGQSAGCAFEVTLPAPATASPARPLASLRDVDATIDAQLRERQPCVLVAEDNPVNQKVARAFLEKLGVRVDCVGNGREAVTAVTRFPYDLVLMDCQMPIMDGYAATEHLRALQGSAREIPVVALTADALDSARERCFAVGMDGFLTKPLQLPALRYALYETLLLGMRANDPVAFSSRGRVMDNRATNPAPSRQGAP